MNDDNSVWKASVVGKNESFPSYRRRESARTHLVHMTGEWLCSSLWIHAKRGVANALNCFFFSAQFSFSHVILSTNALAHAGRITAFCHCSDENHETISC